MSTDEKVKWKCVAPLGDSCDCEDPYPICEECIHYRVITPSTKKLNKKNITKVLHKMGYTPKRERSCYTCKYNPELCPKTFDECSGKNYALWIKKELKDKENEKK